MTDLQHNRNQSMPQLAKNQMRQYGMQVVNQQQQQQQNQGGYNNFSDALIKNENNSGLYLNPRNPSQLSQVGLQSQQQYQVPSIQYNQAPSPYQNIQYSSRNLQPPQQQNSNNIYSPFLSDNRGQRYSDNTPISDSIEFNRRRQGGGVQAGIGRGNNPETNSALQHALYGGNMNNGYHQQRSVQQQNGQQRNQISDQRAGVESILQDEDQREFLGEIEFYNHLKELPKEQKREEVKQYVYGHLQEELKEIQTKKSFKGQIQVRFDQFQKMNTSFLQVQIQFGLVRKSDVLKERENFIEAEKEYQNYLKKLNQQQKNAPQKQTPQNVHDLSSILRGGGNSTHERGRPEFWRPKCSRKSKFLSVDANWMVLAIKETYSNIQPDNDYHLYLEYYGYTKLNTEIVRQWTILPLFNQYSALIQGNFAIPFYSFSEPIWKIFFQGINYSSPTQLLLRITIPGNRVLDDDRLPNPSSYHPIDLHNHNKRPVDPFFAQKQEQALQINQAQQQRAKQQEIQQLINERENQNKSKLIQEISKDLEIIPSKQKVVRAPNRFEQYDSENDQLIQSVDFHQLSLGPQKHISKSISTNISKHDINRYRQDLLERNLKQYEY